MEVRFLLFPLLPDAPLGRKSVDGEIPIYFLILTTRWFHTAVGFSSGLFFFYSSERQTNKVRKGWEREVSERKKKPLHLCCKNRKLFPPFVRAEFSSHDNGGQVEPPGVGVCICAALSAYMEGKYFYANVMILCSIHNTHIEGLLFTQFGGETSQHQSVGELMQHSQRLSCDLCEKRW